MNTPLLSAAVFAGLLSSLHAAIPLPGSLVYSQNFDVLDPAPPASSSITDLAWNDDSTIPGWVLYKAGPTEAGQAPVDYKYRVSYGEPGFGNAGGLADTGHFYSIGALNGTDRALGSVPITGKGEHSLIAVFQNTSGRRVRLTNISYQTEVWRTNQNAGVVETIAVSWRKATSQAAFLTNTTATATAADWPAALSTGPSGLYVTGWNQLPAAYFTYSNPAANALQNPAVISTVNTAPGSEVLLETGEFLAVRWGNINDSGADAIMGIDDVALTFTAEDTGVTVDVTGVSRSDAGSARVPGDDTVSATLTATSSTGGSTWVITSPVSLAGRSGSFGTPYLLADVPIAEFTGPSHTLNVRLEDQANPAAHIIAQITAPWCRITPPAADGFSYDDKGTATAADDEVSYTLQAADGIFTGGSATVTPPGASAPYGATTSITRAAPGTYVTHAFADDADATCTASSIVFPPGIIGTVATTFNPVALLSEPIAQNGAVAWTINGTARTLVQTGSTVQTDHIIRSQVVDLSNAGDVNFTATLAAAGGTTGFEAADGFAMDLIIDDGAPVSVLGAADTDGNGRLAGATELTSRTYNFTYPIPAAASSAYVRITGNSNSTDESFTVSALQFAIPQPEITLGVPTTLVRQANGPGVADDTVTFTLAVTGQFGGTGWVATGALPAAGAFGTIFFSVPAGARSAIVRISDNTYPAVFKEVMIAMPGPYTIGAYNPATGSPVPLLAATTPAPDAAWNITGPAPAVSMNGVGLVAPFKTVTSEEITLGPGAWQVTANLHILDLTGGFEAADEFNAYVILDGNTANPLSLIQAHDTNSSGTLAGAELCPAPAINPTVQNFDYALSAAIPAGTARVQVVITGLCNSANENMIVSNLLISRTTGITDTDGDGVSDADETIMGTSSTNGADVLRLTTTDTGISFPTVAGRFYRLYASSVTPGQEATHLQTWIDLGTTIPGDGSTASIPIAPTAGADRRFYRLHVQTFDTGWPPQVP